jgi:phosphatidate cytidylyltransferase
MKPTSPRPGRFGDLGTRVASGLVLAALATVAIWLGGIFVLVLVVAALCLMTWELWRMATGDGTPQATGLVAMVGAGFAAMVMTAVAGPGWGIAWLAAGAVAAYLLAPKHGDLLAAGLLYMGLPLMALLAIRLAGPEGAFVILWLVLVVAAADVGAYFVGRTLGGPKLAPRISPGKTWSGALGGLAAAGTAGLVMAVAMDWNPGRALALGIGVAVASQAGDLLESAVKRHFGVKDASQLIPGHGGVMDRLDALIGGAWFYALWSLVGPGVNGA